MKIELELIPWTTPNFVRIKTPISLKQDGPQETPAIPLSEIHAEVLGEMCDHFRAEIFKKANKNDPRTLR